MLCEKAEKWLKEFVHNCIVHPAMMFLPSDKASLMHDKNADWAFGKDSRYDELSLERNLGNEKEKEE